MRAHKRANIGPTPIALYQQVVNFGKRAQSPAEPGVKSLVAVTVLGNLIGRAQHDLEQVLRPVGKLEQDELQMILLPLALDDFGAQGEARPGRRYHECEQ